MFRTLIYIILMTLSTSLSSQSYYEKKQLCELCKFSELMQEYFDKYDIPESLKVIPIVESGLNLEAKSHMGAVGPWQLTPVVATMYDIEYQSYNDERMCIVKSTEVACQYLRYLHNKFKRWDYVLIAWNWGEGNVLRLIQKGYGYEAILEESPSETKGFVRRVNRYSHLFTGFRCSNEYYYNVYQVRDITLSLDEISNCTGIDLTLLIELNPVYDGCDGDETLLVLPNTACDYSIF